ncbi:MAG: zinc-binding alcohol dehydrogenase [Armatimonadetes bacterium]|nr:zinc-binding alcohol dehydrogenase [Armatimonadota bacterium]
MPEDRQIVVTGPRRVELLPAPRPDTAVGAGEVAGSTVYSLVSPGTELNYCYFAAEFPRHPGYASVFRIEAVGDAVTDLSPGDLALCMGNHRSWQRCRRADVIPVPAGLDAVAAPFARLMNVSWSTLTTTTARPADAVLVTGLGPVGHLAAQIFAAAGYRVTGVDPSPARRALAESKGLATVPTCAEVDPALAGTFGLCVECSGHEQAVLDACRLVRKRGEVVLVGVPWRKLSDLPAHDLLHVIFHRYVVLRSGWEWEVPTHPRDFSPTSLDQQMTAALDWLRAGRVDVAGLAEVVAPGECDEAYRRLAEQAIDGLSVLFAWE